VKNRIGEPMSFWQAYDFDTIRAGMYVQSVQTLASLGGTAWVNCAEVRRPQCVPHDDAPLPARGAQA